MSADETHCNWVHEGTVHAGQRVFFSPPRPMKDGIGGQWAYVRRLLNGRACVIRCDGEDWDTVAMIRECIPAENFR